MDEEQYIKLRALLDNLEDQNQFLMREIDAYSRELAEVASVAEDWELKWHSCNEELTKLKKHLDALREVWHDEFCRELGHNVSDGGCTDCFDPGSPSL